MKAYYLGCASSKEEQQKLKTNIKNEHKEDSDFYSVYVDVADIYHKNLYFRNGYNSMMNAIYNGNITSIYVPDFKAFNMSEVSILSLLLQLKSRGVIVEVGDSFSTEMDEKLIIRTLYEMYLKRIFFEYSVDLIMFSKVYVTNIFEDAPYVYLNGKEKKGLDKAFCKEMDFTDLIIEYKNGIYIYVPEHDSWDFLDEFVISCLLKYYLEFYASININIPEEIEVI